MSLDFTPESTVLVIIIGTYEISVDNVEYRLNPPHQTQPTNQPNNQKKKKKKNKTKKKPNKNQKKRNKSALFYWKLMVDKEQQTMYGRTLTTSSNSVLLLLTSV